MTAPCRNLPTISLLTDDVVIILAMIGVCTLILLIVIFGISGRRR